MENSLLNKRSIEYLISTTILINIDFSNRESADKTKFQPKLSFCKKKSHFEKNFSEIIQ